MGAHVYVRSKTVDQEIECRAVIRPCARAMKMFFFDVNVKLS